MVQRMGKAVKTVALELQPCCGNRSGVGTYTFELAKRLHSDDELRFCGNVFNFCGRNDNREALRGIEMPLNESRMFPYGIYRRVWNVLPASYERFFPTQADLSIFFNYIVPPRIGGKVITTVYDMTYLRFPETMDARNRRRLNGGLRRSVARSDRILTISAFSKREIHKLLRVPEKQIEVIPCAPNYASDTADFETTAGKYGVRKPYLLYVGNIEPRKNLPGLLLAFALLKERYHAPHQLVLAGGKGWNNAEFDRALAESKVKDEVLLTGYVTGAEKNSLYQHADAFVFPSLYEGFGIPPLEAMHWGCPVVASSAASLPEVCGDAAELVNPLDTESIAEGIWRVLSDARYADELRAKGLKRAGQYTWEASAQRLKAVCKEVLDE